MSTLDSLYSFVTRGYGIKNESKQISNIDWPELVRKIKTDTKTSFTDAATTFFRTQPVNQRPIDFLQSAISERNRKEAIKMFNQEHYYYIPALLGVPQALTSFINIISNVYATEGSPESVSALPSLGIPKHTAQILDNDMEKKFLVYVYACIERDEEAIPVPFKDNRATLRPQWKRWIRGKLDKFTCSTLDLKIVDNCK